MIYITLRINDPEQLKMYRRMASIDLGVREYTGADKDNEYTYLMFDIKRKSLVRGLKLDPNDIDTTSYKEFIKECKKILNETIT